MRELTEVRGPDEFEEYSGPFRKSGSGGRMPTQAELVARPFVSSPISPRCWCGRPVKDSTKRCLREHYPEGL